MMGCKKCSKICGLGFLILGVLFLLVDLGVWTFWNIHWWTAILVWMGFGGMAMSKCPDCCAVMGWDSKKK